MHRRNAVKYEIDNNITKKKKKPVWAKKTLDKTIEERIIRDIRHTF